MISFRLTAEQYDRCRELCLAQGLRSVSEIARTGINLLLQQPDGCRKNLFETRVAELEGRLHMLTLELRKLHQNGTRAPAVPTGVAQRTSE